MRRSFLSLWVLSLLTSTPAMSEEVWRGSFDSERWLENWQAHSKRSFGLKRARLLRSDSDPDILRVFYPKRSATGSLSRKLGLPEGGAQFLTTVPTFPKEGADQAILAYEVRFAPNFDFVKGGKLPGLFGGERISGKDYPTGDDGFSTRLHWRADGYGEIKAYLPVDGGSAPEFGKNSFRFRPGKWHQIQQQVVLNDPEKKNGHLLMWFDGKLVISEKAVFYRTSPQLRIEGLFFSTFFGGATKEWASKKDTYADFRNFSVRTP